MSDALSPVVLYYMYLIAAYGKGGCERGDICVSGFTLPSLHSFIALQARSVLCFEAAL